jgi:FKBP-type peptidyl-prolyl cis-trans isomerase
MTIKNIGVFFLALFLILACDIAEKEPSTTMETKRLLGPISTEDEAINRDTTEKQSDSSLIQNQITDTAFNLNVNIKDIVDEFNFVGHLKTPSGIQIDWIEKKDTRSLQKGELLMLEYRLSLPDGKIIDGNNRMKMPYLPFVLGFNMQNRGWDEALEYLSVGDIAQIKIPSELAYGKKGLGDLIPPNSENWLFVKVHGIVSESSNSNGVKTWELRSGKEDVMNKESKVKFHMIASTESRSNIFNTYASNFPVTYTRGQKNYPKGLRQVLNNAKNGQQLFVILDAAVAYGAKGYMDLVRPNEKVFYNLKILEVK